ncbi:hypothetical protein Psi02_31110 [Planotetraspora silvatica]|uniref:Uncharacterized protein n=1 Tax=Planotetraspora silvatica TaxID=234614 RepID=A0A8J3XLV7_9ACTN|nr:hypothetical protein [Planotetraspora silvatica]GII46687.1 hypothetical protein Psi02_31110 [Planotetraspora silvatica]
MDGEGTSEPDLQTLAAQAVADRDYEQARRHLARLRTSNPAGLVSVAPNIYDMQGTPRPHGNSWEPGWHHISPSFLVVTPDPERAAAAMHRAGLRFGLVTEDGRELRDWECDVSDAYTPNYISPIHLTEAGPAFYADTKGELSTPMAEAMLHVLVDELIAEEVPSHVTSPPSRDFDHEVWTPPSAEPEKAGGARAWFVARPVIRPVGDGRHYRDHEYRRADGIWTRDLSVAEQFTTPPNELVEALRNLPTPGLHHAMGLLLELP